MLEFPFSGRTVRPAAFFTNDHDHERPLRVDMIEDQYGGSSWFYGYVETSFDPVRVLVRADDITDAYETLLCNASVERDCEITAADAADYPPAGSDDDHTTWNENGRRLDTESVMLHGPCTVRLILERDLPAGF